MTRATLPLLVAAAFWMATPASADPALDCTPSPGRAAAFLSGEVGGRHANRQAVGPGWNFALLPAAFGYDLRLFDGEGRDLSAMTPPLHGVPNSRELYGWHFRSADNSGPNRGDVNAPQELRLFLFDPDPAADPGQAQGRGWLKVRDYGLADLAPGEKARMVYLSFEACLFWPAEAEPVAEPVTEPPAIAPETREIFGRCGLGPTHELVRRLDPQSLGGDFDDDGSLDEAALVQRRSDGQHGLAICRAGTWLNLVGFDEEIGELVPAYFDRMDWWGLHEKGPVGQGADGTPPPQLFGDAILLGKEDSSSVLLYWTPDGYRSYWQGD